MWSGARGATSSSGADVICDAGPLIHLDELGCLDVLADFRAVLVPDQVWREVSHHGPHALEHPDVKFRHVKVSLSDDPSFQALIKALALDAGEQAALSLMRHHPDAILLTDDAAARVAAKSLSYKAHGTIGILLRAIRRQQRTTAEIVSILRQLPKRSALYLRSDLLRDIIRELERQVSAGDG